MTALKRQESCTSTRDVCREPGISEATFYNWKAKCGGMEVYDVAGMKPQEAALSKYKKMVAERSLENRAMKNFIEKKW